MSKLENLIRQARGLATKLEAAANEAAVGALRARPETVREAVREAVTALYLGENHKHEFALRRVVRCLAPEVYDLIDERGISEAFNAVRVQETT